MWNHEQLETVKHIPQGISLRSHKVGQSIHFDATVFRDAEGVPTHDSGKKFVGNRLQRLQFVLAKLSEGDEPGADLLRASEEIAYDGPLSKDPKAHPVLRPFESLLGNETGLHQDLFRTSGVHPSEHHESRSDAEIHETILKAAENMKRASVAKTEVVFLPHEKDEMRAWIEHVLRRELSVEHRHLASGYAQDIHRQVMESVNRHLETD